MGKGSNDRTLDDQLERFLAEQRWSRRRCELHAVCGVW